MNIYKTSLAITAGDEMTKEKKFFSIYIRLIFKFQKIIEGSGFRGQKESNLA
jgi:hypothetical protein